MKWINYGLVVSLLLIGLSLLFLNREQSHSVQSATRSAFTYANICFFLADISRQIHHSALSQADLPRFQEKYRSIFGDQKEINALMDNTFIEALNKKGSPDEISQEVFSSCLKSSEKQVNALYR